MDVYAQDEYEMACLEKGHSPFAREELRPEGVMPSAASDDEDRDDKKSPQRRRVGRHKPKITPKAAVAAAKPNWPSIRAGV
eukprot:363421-Chlamydomonas_euryale.AAC.4